MNSCKLEKMPQGAARSRKIDRAESDAQILDSELVFMVTACQQEDVDVVETFATK